MFLKNQRLYRRSHYPTHVNSLLLGQVFEDVTNAMMVWRKLNASFFRLNVLHITCLMKGNHNVWTYREDFLAALVNILTELSAGSEAEYRGLEDYLSERGPDESDEDEADEAEEDGMGDEDRHATMQFFRLFQRQETSRRLVRSVILFSLSFERSVPCW